MKKTQSKAPVRWLLSFCTSLILLALPFVSKAQCHIMDAATYIDTSGSGHSIIYLTDTNNIQSVRIQIGSQPDSFSAYSISITYGSSGNLVVSAAGQVDMYFTGVPSLLQYYYRYSIILRDNSVNQIVLEK